MPQSEGELQPPIRRPMITSTSSSNTNFRAGYYAKLGIHRQPPAAPRSTRCQGAKQPAAESVVKRPAKSPPCLLCKRSVLHTTPAKEQHVSFHPEVKLYRIKHHDDYSLEEWDNMWVDGDTLEYEKERNTFEFSMDGAHWRSATEEEDFEAAADGSLVHPATWLAYRRHWENNGVAAPLAVDFKALLFRPPSRRWSPRPQRKTFWLLELALESVHKGKTAFGNRRKHQVSRTSAVTQIHPPRQVDRGWP